MWKMQGAPVFTGILAVLCVPCFSWPSTRVVYYLHTRAATWNEARAMCESYDGTLVTVSDFTATNNSVTYVDANFWDSSLSSVAGSSGFWSGLYEHSSGVKKWLGCENYTASALPQVDDSNPGWCFKSDLSFSLTSASCGEKRPYICQRDDGQCWFQPYMDVKITDSDADSSENATTAATEGDCAKMCRSSMDGTSLNGECWAFSYKVDTQDCLLHFSNVNHKYALNRNAAYYQPATDFTAYVKICTGGWTSNLAPAVSIPDNAPADENCTAVGPDEWDDLVCYCECDQPPVILEAESLVMTIDEKVDQIVKELHVDPTNTSSTRRKKTSVEDHRPSAQGIGYMGLAFMAVVFGGIALMDLNVLISAVQDLYKGFKDRKNATRDE